MAFLCGTCSISESLSCWNSALVMSNSFSDRAGEAARGAIFVLSPRACMRFGLSCVSIKHIFFFWLTGENVQGGEAGGIKQPRNKPAKQCKDGKLPPRRVLEHVPKR